MKLVKFSTTLSCGLLGLVMSASAANAAGVSIDESVRIANEVAGKCSETLDDAGKCMTRVLATPNLKCT